MEVLKMKLTSKIALDRVGFIPSYCRSIPAETLLNRLINK